MTPGYPFSAVVGLDDLRLSLLLNAVSPAVGGVLVRGEKGTAKSTMVRALAALLPRTDLVVGCRFGCDPTQPDPACPDGPHDEHPEVHTRQAALVELPVGATEDRLVGSLDLERALADGVRAYEPGLLAAAHRGVLYVDEVNLLHDHLVDLLLDAAAMGTAHVEREGVSVRHAARFLLVGTMNPEEGELRPQLLDRFGLTVEVTASRDARQRAEVVRRRLAFDADPAAFAARWQAQDQRLPERVAAARAALPAVQLPDRELERIARVCAAFEVDGLRADLVTARAALALAAWHGRREVTVDEVRRAAQLSLPHRRRRNPFDAPGLDDDLLERALQDTDDTVGTPNDDNEPTNPDDPGGTPDPDDRGPDRPGGGTPRPPAAPSPPAPPPAAVDPQPQTVPHQEDRSGTPFHDTSTAPTPSSGTGRAAGEQAAVTADRPFRARLLTVPGVGSGAAGRRSRAWTTDGHTTGNRRPTAPVRRLHLAGTVRAAAPHQRARGRTTGRLLLRPDDVREAVREGREGNLVLFVVDASGSMAARQRMRTVKTAVLSLLLDAYQRRDKVGLVTFRGADADLTLPPTSSVEAGAARLQALPTGGRTPLAAGLLRAHRALHTERMRDPRRRPLLVVVTDGRATHGTDPLGDARRAAALLAADGTAAVVVDCESGPVRLGLAGQLADDLAAPMLDLSALAADGLAGLVRDLRRAG